MKFNLSSKTFYSYAAAVGKVVNPKSTIPVLNNFLLSLNDSTLSITGCDIENLLTATLPVEEAEGSGSFCVDAARLVSLLKEIPDQGLTVIVDNDLKVTIKYQNGECEFVALNAADYPEYKKKEDDTDEPQSFSIPASALTKGIDNTIFASSNDDFRPMMMGLFLDIKPDNITFVATDTRKLVRYIDSNIKPGITTSCIVPQKPAQIMRTVFNDDDEVMVTLTRKSATLKNGSYTFNCRFIDSVFPDYNRVIPRNNQLTLTADRVALLNVVRRMSLFITQDYGLEKFKITPSKVEVKVEDFNMMSKALESLPVDFTGEQLVIGFNAPFLIEILNTLKSTDVIINLSDPSRPGLFRPSEEPEGTELVMLLMPMTVGEF